MQVVQKTQSLKKISFLAHSLGGLFARYAVSVLYTPHGLSSGEPDDSASSIVENSQTACSSRRGMIAGLEPINFITLATPHLGVRGRKQVCPQGCSSLCLVYHSFAVNHPILMPICPTPFFWLLCSNFAFLLHVCTPLIAVEGFVCVCVHGEIKLHFDTVFQFVKTFGTLLI
jgi:hypothetical protein